MRMIRILVWFFLLVNSPKVTTPDFASDRNILRYFNMLNLLTQSLRVA